MGKHKGSGKGGNGGYHQLENLKSWDVFKKILENLNSMPHEVKNNMKWKLFFHGTDVGDGNKMTQKAVNEKAVLLRNILLHKNVQDYDDDRSLIRHNISEGGAYYLNPLTGRTVKELPKEYDVYYNGRGVFLGKKDGATRAMIPIDADIIGATNNYETLKVAERKKWYSDTETELTPAREHRGASASTVRLDNSDDELIESTKDKLVHQRFDMLRKKVEDIRNKKFEEIKEAGEKEIKTYVRNSDYQKGFVLENMRMRNLLRDKIKMNEIILREDPSLQESDREYLNKEISLLEKKIALSEAEDSHAYKNASDYDWLSKREREQIEQHEQEMKQAFDKLKQIKDVGRIEDIEKEAVEMRKLVDDGDKLEITEMNKEIDKTPALTMNEKIQYQKKAHDQFKMNKPEGIEFFNNVFKAEYKKEHSTPQQLKKDLAIVDFKVDKNTFENNILKAVQKNESIRGGNQYKTKGFLDHISNRPSLQSSLEKALNKLTKK